MHSRNFFDSTTIIIFIKYVNPWYTASHYCHVFSENSKWSVLAFLHWWRLTHSSLWNIFSLCIAIASFFTLTLYIAPFFFCNKNWKKMEWVKVNYLLSNISKLKLKFRENSQNFWHVIYKSRRILFWVKGLLIFLNYNEDEK